MSTSYVGLGWFVDTNLGTEIKQHSGSIDGYSIFIGFNPDKQVGLVELCSLWFDPVNIANNTWNDVFIPVRMWITEPSRALKADSEGC